jgi:hypothetical protein
MALRYEMGGEPSYNNEQELVRISRSIKRWSLASLIVGVVLAASALCLISSGESLTISDAEHSVGSDKEDWWIEYPNSDSEVGHPEWVLDALKKGPVLIFDHSTNCVGCIDQGNYIESVLEDFDDDEIIFYDIIAGEDDSRGYELFYIYEPNGLIPLTILLTLVQDSEGDVVVGWHGVVGATGEEWIRSYVEDAIIYYDENSENWNS